MKKLIALLLSILMVLTLCACGAEKQPAEPEQQDETPAEETVEEPAAEESEEAAEPMVGMANPMTEYTSLEEINEIVGCRLCHPAVPGVTEEKFFTINCGDFTIAQYTFSLYGNEYCFRSAPVADQDISGVYVGEGTAFEGGANDVLAFCMTEDCKLARWFDMNGQYVLCVTDNGTMEEETFRGIAEEMRDLTDPAFSESDFTAYYASLAGSYQDGWSQRASAEVTADGAVGIQVVVLWGDSAFETYRWTMHANRTEDGLLCYSDCVKELLSYDNDGNESVSVQGFPAEGFFGESEGVLYWNGAGDEYCEQCRFEMIPA